jgi:hypothetical protein
MIPIGTAVHTSGTTSVMEFSNVPQGYKHLIVVVATAGVTSGQRGTVVLKFNDSETGYPYISTWNAVLGGSTVLNGGTIGSNVNHGTPLSVNLMSGQNTFGGIYYVMDYSNPNKFKSVLRISGAATGVTADIIGSDMGAGAWENMFPITKVTVNFLSNILPGSMVSLYGVA